MEPKPELTDKQKNPKDYTIEAILKRIETRRAMLERPEENTVELIAFFNSL